MPKSLEALKHYPIFLTIFLLTLLFQIVGMFLGIFIPGLHLDKVVHFLLPATGAPLLYALLISWNVLKPLGTAGTLLIIFCLGVTAESIWELIEFVIDLTTVYSLQYTLRGTILDMLMAVLGSLVGGFFFLRAQKN